MRAACSRFRQCRGRGPWGERRGQVPSSSSGARLGVSSPGSCDQGHEALRLMFWDNGKVRIDFFTLRTKFPYKPRRPPTAASGDYSLSRAECRRDASFRSCATEPVSSGARCSCSRPSGAPRPQGWLPCLSSSICRLTALGRKTGPCESALRPGLVAVPRAPKMEPGLVPGSPIGPCRLQHDPV